MMMTMVRMIVMTTAYALLKYVLYSVCVVMMMIAIMVMMVVDDENDTLYMLMLIS